MYKRNTTPLEKVLSPFNLGKVLVQNRILMSGMHLGFEHDPDQFQSLADFFGVRAKAGVGLIVVGGCSPDKVGRAIYSSGFCISSDDLIPKHKKITSSIKKHGSVPVLQLCPFGRESFHGHLFAPSPVRAHSNLYTPKDLSEKSIEKNVDDFAKAVLRTREAGYDSVEIVGSQGFLIHQFFANRTNQRTDSWGGSIENRSRYALEVIKRSKKLAGNDFPIIFRLPSLDLVEGGISFDDFQEITKLIVQEKPALINVGIGWHDSPVPSIAMNVPTASFSPVAHYVKSISQNIPVAVSNRINDLRTAERLLLDGVADVVAMGRPFLADPNLIEKSKKGHWNNINTCIACNQACLDNALKGKRVGCIVNPQCGLSNEGIIPQTTQKKSFTIVGGGLAGMSAALWLKRFGHDVTLFESSTFLGGQLSMTIQIPGKEIFKETLRYFEHELYSENVTIKKGYKWQISDYDKDSHVIIATGAIPRKISTPMEAKSNVYSYEEVLRDQLPLVHPVVIIGSGAISVDLVSYISNDKAWEKKAFSYIEPYIDKDQLTAFKSVVKTPPPVTVLSRSKKLPGSTIGATTRWINLQKFKKNIQYVQRVRVTAIRKGYVDIKHIVNDKKKSIAANMVIYAVGQEPENSLINNLEVKNIPYTVVGLENCKDVRYSAGEAIKQGYQCAVSFLKSSVVDRETVAV